MSSAKAYKTVKRRMMAMKNQPAKSTPVKEEVGGGLLKRKPSTKESMPKEDINDVISAYIEAVRGLED